MKLDGKIAIVTGSSRGIGKASALRLSEEGCSVVINSRHLEDAESVVQEIAKNGGKAFAVEADVSDPASIYEMVDKTIEVYKNINILVNCAGMSMAVPAIDIKLEDWNRVLSVNLTSQLFCSQAVARFMKEKGGGKIINITSMLADTIIPGRVGYSVSKAAANHLTRALAIEWAPYNINVNAIGPAYVMTELVRNLIRKGHLNEEKLKSRSPFKRLVTLKEVADAVLFLASDDSSSITGEYLKLDCGWSKYGGWDQF
jgi:NAD(P)-dependent dehydrogenase (short-subunit alcohol dehydrogenase family)